MNESINAKEVSLSYFDACPSEFFYSSNSEYVTHAGIHYFMIYKPELKKIPQFKKSRGLKNKLKWIDFLVKNIENKKIRFYCRAINIRKDIGLTNGFNFLIKEGIIDSTDNIDLNEKVNYKSYEISLKNLITLSCYAISLILISQKLAFISKIENKKKFAFFLDLLPTDSALSTKNLKIFHHLVFRSYLYDYIQDDLNMNQLDKFVIAYGHEDGSTKKIKNWHEYAITDWIIHCINYSANNNQNQTETKRYLEFVKFLTQKGLLDIINCPILKV